MAFTQNEFAKWPLYSGVAVFAAMTGAFALPPILGPAVIIVLLTLPLPVVGLLGAVIWFAAAALFRRQWRRAVSMAAFPLMVIVTVPAADLARSARDEVRFFINKSAYDAEVAEARRQGKHYVTVDDWSLFVTDDTFVVWDEFDHPEEVISGFRPTYIQKLGRHFYKISN
jgi:hypothetical protein